MKDIDFDELDRAVNSLMAPDDSEPAASPKLAQEAPSVPVVPVVVEPAATPVDEPTVIAATAASVPVVVRPATVTTPPPRSSGRFMDMVHTSSDMKTRPDTAPSRLGVTLNPLNPSVVPDLAEPQATQADDEQSVESTSATPTETTGSVDSTSEAAMPDPLDMMTTPEEEVSTPQTSESTPGSEEESTPSGESPFLADTKVEKRPLNADPLSSTEPLVNMEDALKEDPLPSEDTDSAGLTDEHETAENHEDEPPMTPQIPELDSDLVAIESSENTGDTEESKRDQDDKKAPVGPASITQQYKTQESTGDKSHTAIYDTAHYPEPVTHPAKKKSGWMWILWVILLLGIGAGGAAVLYIFHIIP